MTGPKTKHDRGPRESPTNIRNGKDLVDAAIHAFENDRCKTALIQPQGQAFYLDCRDRSFYDFRPHLLILGRDLDDAGRWSVRSKDPRTPYMDSTAPPPPQATARCHIGPHVAKTMQELLISEGKGLLRDNDGMHAHLMVFEGASGRANQTHCVAHTAGEAASIAFHHIANGFSLVFAGIMDRVLYEDYVKMRNVKAWECCKTIQDLEAVATRFSNASAFKKTVGIVY